MSSVVAEEGGEVVGHALFSAATLELKTETVEVGALGPVGVLPSLQRRGIGFEVIRSGFDACWERGLCAIIVLGHPAYYPRFGFSRADAWDIRWERPSSPESFMIAWRQEPLQGPGIARYHAAFGEL